MDKFLSWCYVYSAEITWFLIGFLLSSGLVNLGQGNYGTASIDIILAIINIILYKKR